MKFPAEAFWLIPVGAIVSGASAYAVQYMSIDDAQKLIFPQATAFISQSFGPAAGAQRLWRVEYDGKILGYFVADEVVGKHELITYVVGIGVDKTIKQVEIIEYRESHGSEIRHSDWRAQFVGKSANDRLVVGSDIKNISGATLSCQHVSRGVKQILDLIKDVN